MKTTVVPTSCVVLGCRMSSTTRIRFTVTSPSHPDFGKSRRRKCRLFPLPTDPDRRDVWIQAAVRDPEERSRWRQKVAQSEVGPLSHLSLGFYVCEKHFEEGTPTLSFPDPVLRLGPGSSSSKKKKMKMKKQLIPSSSVGGFCSVSPMRPMSGAFVQRLALGKMGAATRSSGEETQGVAFWASSCAVRSCPVKFGMMKDPSSSVRLFKMPPDGEARERWKDALQEMDPGWVPPRKNVLICERHFESGLPPNDGAPSRNLSPPPPPQAPHPSKACLMEDGVRWCCGEIPAMRKCVERVEGRLNVLHAFVRTLLLQPDAAPPPEPALGSASDRIFAILCRQIFGEVGGGLPKNEELGFDQEGSDLNEPEFNGGSAVDERQVVGRDAADEEKRVKLGPLSFKRKRVESAEEAVSKKVKPGPLSFKEAQIKRIQEEEMKGGVPLLVDADGSSWCVEARETVASATVELREGTDLSALLVELGGDVPTKPPLKIKLEAKGKKGMSQEALELGVGRAALMGEGRILAADSVRSQGPGWLDALENDQMEEVLDKLVAEGLLLLLDSSRRIRMWEPGERLWINAQVKLYRKVSASELETNSNSNKYMLNISAYKSNQLRSTRVWPPTELREIILMEEMLERKRLEAEEADPTNEDIVEKNF